MSYNNYKYAIIEAANIGKIDFSCFKIPQENVRHSLDGNYFLLKYEGNKPYCIYGTTVYTHQEILSILDDPNGIWFNPANLTI